MNLLNAPQPPYVAVIFSSLRLADSDGVQAADGYEAMADAMEALGAEQPGFLGIESARNPDGSGITVSYWRSEADAVAWKGVSEHAVAQRRGQSRWYLSYSVRVAVVTRSYDFTAADNAVGSTGRNQDDLAGRAPLK